MFSISSNVYALIAVGALITGGALITIGVLMSSCCKDTSGISTLKAVSMLTRHGDRAPDYSYPLDPYADYPWPGGLEALSPKGARQLYQSGMSKSSRYSSLLTPPCSFCNFDTNKIFVLSSAYPRCVASATSFLEGFLPTVWPGSLIHVAPSNEDEALENHVDHALYNLFNLSNPNFAETIDFQSDLGKQYLAYMENNTGLVGGSVLSTAEILEIQLANGLTLPEWAAPVYDRYIKPLGSTIKYSLSNSRFMEIRSGILLKDIVDRLQSFLSGSSTENIIFYSGHDANILAMMYLLDMRDQILGHPMYGAMLNVELYDNSDGSGDFEIRIVYFQTHEDENPIELKMPNCSAPCLFKKFVETVKSKYVLDYDEACSQ